MRSHPHGTRVVSEPHPAPAPTLKQLHYTSNMPAYFHAGIEPDELALAPFLVLSTLCQRYRRVGGLFTCRGAVSEVSCPYRRACTMNDTGLPQPCQVFLEMQPG